MPASVIHIPGSGIADRSGGRGALRAVNAIFGTATSPSAGYVQLQLLYVQLQWNVCICKRPPQSPSAMERESPLQNWEVATHSKIINC